VFRGLINKVPMRRLCDLADVSPQMLYQRIGLIHERCREFASRHEQALYAGEHARERMHIAVDRQEHALNSGSVLDRRPILLLAMASAEAYSGYILAQHLNFDPDVDPFELELLAREAGDPETPRAFKQFGRIVLPYERDQLDADEEVPSLGPGFRAVSRGAHVHDAIAMAAHLQVIAKMTRSAGYVQLSMDRETGIERLALLTFLQRMKAGSADAYLVRINKALSQPKKQLAIAEAEANLAKAKARRPDMDERAVLFGLIESRYRKLIRSQPDARHRWVEHPYPTMSEPERAALCLSDDGERSRDQVIAGFARASLRSIDRYFMQVRRKVHVLERPISSASAAGRAWYGYSAYSAVVVMKLLEIFRTVYNYHLAGGQSTTPAQRLGLAEQRYELRKLLGYS
jgi:hypothetical protein